MSRFKQMLIREGKGWRQERKSQKKQKKILGQGPLVPPQGIHKTIYELFCGYWKKLMVSTHKHMGPRPVGTRGWYCWLSPHHQPIGRMSTTLFDHYYKASHYLCHAWTHSFEGISPWWSPLPSKATKLYSISPKTLSPRFNCVEVQKLIQPQPLHF